MEARNGYGLRRAIYRHGNIACGVVYVCLARRGKESRYLPGEHDE